MMSISILTLYFFSFQTGNLAMESLLSLTSKKAGEWFKEELRTVGGLDHIVDSGLWPFVREISFSGTVYWIIPPIPQYSNFCVCLYVCLL